VGSLTCIQAAETHVEEESHRLCRLSVSTLCYMIDYGVALENRLTHHRLNLRYEAEETFDLLEAMRLSARLNQVESNISRRGRLNARIRAEILRRAAEDTSVEELPGTTEVATMWAAR
jgi:hypothetical protein